MGAMFGCDYGSEQESVESSNDMMACDMAMDELSLGAHIPCAAAPQQLSAPMIPDSDEAQ